jgi:DNA polymerase I-like protein with 3'-5' exonuclease and polymerase domains
MTVLLTHYPDLYRETIVALVEERYGIKNATFNIKFINQLVYADGYQVTGLVHPIITDYWGIQGDGVVRVEDVEDFSAMTDIVASQYIKPIITWTDELATAAKWLATIATKYPTIAVDFESKDLTLPQFNNLTMVTIGWHRTKSIVIVFKDQAIQDYVLNWLVTTDCVQVYHNALFDTRLIHHATGKLPKHIEDSQLLAAVYRNHVDQSKRSSGLKELAKFPYLDWASDKTSFELYLDSSTYVNSNLVYVGNNQTPHMYNLPLIYYCGVDSCATHHVWTKFDTEPAVPSQWIFQHSEPRYNTEQFNQRYYYEFILKPAIPVVVRMLNQGQAIDIAEVQALSDQVEEVKSRCLGEINKFKIIQDFMKPLDDERLAKFLEPIHKVWKHPQYTGFKANPDMRAFVVNHLIGSTYETLSDKELKLLVDPVLQPLKDKNYDAPEILAACNLYAEAEALRQNTQANRIDKVTHPEKYIDLGFNPYNYVQLTKMWLTFGLESDEISKKTGQMSFSGTVLKTLSKTTTGDLQQIIKLYLEIAESKNMVTQYIPKYIGSTLNDRVYGSIRLMGTISGRLSGKAAKMTDEESRHRTGINLVTQPASSSAFAKPVKKLFIAPKGKLIIAIDYANLEGHVGAILTHDETSVRNLQQNFDTHCLHSAAYWTQAWEDLSGIPFDKTSLTVNKQYKALCSTDPAADKLRSKSKGVSFGLALTTSLAA